MKAFHHTKLFIKDHGILHWLFIKQQIKRQYNPYRLLKYSGNSNYYEFQRAMMLWDNSLKAKQ